MSTQDEYGRVTAMNSVHLILLARRFFDHQSTRRFEGTLRDRAAGDRDAEFLVGSLAVAGEMRPYNDLPLVVELVDRDGRVIASARL